MIGQVCAEVGFDVHADLEQRGKERVDVLGVEQAILVACNANLENALSKKTLTVFHSLTQRVTTIQFLAHQIGHLFIILQEF